VQERWLQGRQARGRRLRGFRWRWRQATVAAVPRCPACTFTLSPPPHAPLLQQEKLRAEFDQLKKLVSLAGGRRSLASLRLPSQLDRPASTPAAGACPHFTRLLTWTACLLCLPCPAFLPACLPPLPALPACLLTWTACLPCLPACLLTWTACLPACLQDDPIQIERALERGEARLREHLHPDPYIGE
jgi:hypothetical protein